MTDTTEDATDLIISVDDHVIEPPGLWVERVPRRCRDRVPHVVEEGGASYWIYEDTRTPISGLFVQAGRSEEEIGPELMSYERMRPAYFDAKERAKDLDVDGVIASLCFPTIPRYCGQTFLEAADRETALMCLRAYNDWMIEEWAGGAPGRFIPLVILPLWDAWLAAEEVHRTAEWGAKAVAFSENPAKLGLPSVHDRDGYWDPFLAAIDETAMPLCIHFGSSSMVPNTSDDAPIYVSALLSPLNLAYATADWLFSPHLSRYPNLKICLSEGGIGWIPYILERADYIIETMRWAERFDPSTPAGAAQPVRTFEVGPAELFRDHIYGCFINDEFGLENLSRIGADNVMIETDYPHGDGTFPGSRENARRLLSNLTPEDRYKIMQGNARRVFNLSGVAPEE